MLIANLWAVQPTEATDRNASPLGEGVNLGRARWRHLAALFVYPYIGAYERYS
jgi:hypothetical protein